MPLSERELEVALRHYEGLIFKTAQLTAPLVEEDLDDIMSLLRIKAWRAIEAYDPRRSRMSRDRYVFMVLKNQTKDIVKKKRRGELYIEDVAPNKERAKGHQGDAPRDRFDERYLSSSPDEVFGLVEAELPVIPSTLNELERQVLCLLYADYRQTEVACYLGVDKRDVERAVRALKTKMADWRPTPAPVETPLAA